MFEIAEAAACLCSDQNCLVERGWCVIEKVGGNGGGEHQERNGVVLKYHEAKPSESTGTLMLVGQLWR